MGFLFGSDGDVFQEEGFDLFGKDVFLDVACGGRELDQGWFGVDYHIDFAVLVLSADISWVYLVEGSLPMVQLNLSLALDEVLPVLILSDPLAVDLACRNTDVD